MVKLILKTFPPGETRWKKSIIIVYIQQYIWEPNQHNQEEKERLPCWLNDGVITHLEPDILECKVKWALGSITTNKASGGDGIPAELFQIVKDDAVKVLHSVCQQIRKTQQWLQAGKGRFWFQSQRKAMPKNVQTAARLHSFHMLAKLYSKFSKLGFNSMWTENFQIFKLDLEKAEEPKIKLLTSAGS